MEGLTLVEGSCGGVGVGVGVGGSVVSELSRVQQLVRELEVHLHAPSSSVDLCRHLVAQIIALTDRSIGMVRSSSAAAHFADAATPPHSGTPSPLSDVSDHQPFRTTTPKKRKAAAKWTSQVRVSTAGGAEGPGDDGHSWRKYGQKDILGAKHPRGYYRCTHRNSQGCMATKQVQRADGDDAVFDVVYHGEHTCRPAAAAGGGRRPPTPHNPHAHSLLQSLSAGLTVATASASPLVSPSALTPENLSAPSLASPSPVASDSNGGGLVMSPCPVLGRYGEWHTSDGDLQEVVSALATVSAAAPPAPMPAIDDDLLHYCFDFDPSFDFDAPASFFQ